MTSKDIAILLQLVKILKNSYSNINDMPDPAIDIMDIVFTSIAKKYVGDAENRVTPEDMLQQREFTR